MSTPIAHLLGQVRSRREAQVAEARRHYGALVDRLAAGEPADGDTADNIGTLLDLLAADGVNENRLCQDVACREAFERDRGAAPESLTASEAVRLASRAVDAAVARRRELEDEGKRIENEARTALSRASSRAQETAAARDRVLRHADPQARAAFDAAQRAEGELRERQHRIVSARTGATNIRGRLIVQPDEAAALDLSDEHVAALERAVAAAARTTAERLRTALDSAVLPLFAVDGEEPTS